jgi:exodeoxyribonuclease VIII
MIELKPIPTPMTTELDGWYQMGNDTYHTEAPGLSCSGLKLIAKSPAHYQCRDEYEETPAMAFGAAVHCAVLEPEVYANAYRVFADGTRFTAKLKDEHAEQGLTPIKQADHDRIRRIAEAVRNHPDAAALLADGQAEASGFWKDPATGVQCKLRADFVNPGLRAVVDLKTAGNPFGAKNGSPARPEAWRNTVARTNGHWQPAWYLTGASIITGERWEDFAWIVVEPDPPFVVGVYQASRNLIYQASEEIKPVVAKYADCLRRDEWPVPRYGLEEMSLPDWRVREFEFHEG